jgi:hypothetical protein
VRIIAIQGGKGGIFKTGTAQAVTAWLDRAGVTWAGADTDQENKTFADVYAGRVAKFDVYDPVDGKLRYENVNQLVNAIDAARQAGSTEVFVLDQGAGQANVLRGALEATGMIDDVRTGTLRLTIVFLVVNTDPSLSTLAANLERTFPDVPNVDWIIAANEYLDTSRSRVSDALRDPKLAALIAGRNAVTIRVPLIEDSSVVLEWVNSHAPLSDFQKNGSFAERGRINVWASTVFAELTRVGDLIRDTEQKKARATARGAA